MLVPGISQILEVGFWNLLYLLPGHKVVFESSGGKRQMVVKAKKISSILANL